MHIVIFFFLLFNLVNASENLAFEKLERVDILPCTIAGCCTQCGTSNCSSCSKCSPGFCEHDDRDVEPGNCTACDNTSLFCTEPGNACFKVSKAARKICRDKEGCSLGSNPPHTVFIPRSQGSNTALRLTGWQEFIHQYDVGSFYLTTGHAFGYYRTFRPDWISCALFGESNLRFAGSQAEKRGHCPLLADNFGLSTRFRGSVSFEPIIENFLFDNQFFIGLDPIWPGLYFEFHIPLVHTRWSLNMCQTLHPDSATFPKGYMAANEAEASNDIIKVLGGDFTFGDMRTPWPFGRLSAGTCTKTGVADIDFTLGWDFIAGESYHFGLGIHVVAPTGNKLDGRRLFEPIIGNNKHWEAGISASGHYRLWEKDTDYALGIYFVGNVTHLFKNRQCRSFDFCNSGPLSRYLLLKEFTPELTYAENLINGIGFATREVEVYYPVKADLAATLCYRTPHLMVDLGYNFYGRSREHLVGCFSADKSRFGIKGTSGTQSLVYKVNEEPRPAHFGQLVAQENLAATQHNATIRRSAQIDNGIAVATVPDTIAVTALSRQEGPVEGNDVLPAFSSNPPILLAEDDLHIESGLMPALLSNKIFGYIGYNFYEQDWCYNPYIGIGGEVEFDGQACDSRSASNQWGIFIKGGFEF